MKLLLQSILSAFFNQKTARETPAVVILLYIGNQKTKELDTRGREEEKEKAEKLTIQVQKGDERS